MKILFRKSNGFSTCFYIKKYCYMTATKDYKREFILFWVYYFGYILLAYSKEICFFVRTDSFFYLRPPICFERRKITFIVISHTPPPLTTILFVNLLERTSI